MEPVSARAQLAATGALPACRPQPKVKGPAKVQSTAQAAPEEEADAAVYERIPRRRLAEAKTEGKAASGLPFKTQDGQLIFEKTAPAELPKVSALS